MVSGPCLGPDVTFDALIHERHPLYLLTYTISNIDVRKFKRPEIEVCGINKLARLEIYHLVI